MRTTIGCTAASVTPRSKIPGSGNRRRPGFCAGADSRTLAARSGSGGEKAMQIQVNDIRVHYRIDGEEGAPWLTFVTGIANDLSMWDGQLPALRDFRVLRYDLRGQGGTEATTGPYSMALLVADLAGLWDELEIGATHLAGLGLGGAIAQAVAIDHPDRVASLVPCCCRARMVPEFATLWHGLIETVRTKGLESIVEPTAQR